MNFDPTALYQQAVALEAQLKTALGQADYWRKEAEKRLAEVAAGIRDPGSLIEYIEVNTQLTPAIRVDEPLRQRGGPDTGPDPVLDLVRPQLLVKFKSITKPVEINPWGAPDKNYYGRIQVGGVILAGLAIVGGYTVLSGTWKWASK